jgi:hypothetical protein
MLRTPKSAPVGSPRELESGGKALNARYKYEEPSTRTKSAGVLMVDARVKLPSITNAAGPPAPASTASAHGALYGLLG